ncbi:MAG TPA: hypothetical protein VH280_11675 [Verrucomicrobiae bacterium]|jgi:hypothetical protein|nr:hypothetical protein [Verrucomicrobiae bacterium]
MKSTCFIIALVAACGLNLPVSTFGAQYFLLNYAPDGLYSKPISSSVIINYVSATFGAGNQSSPLKVGVSCLYYNYDSLYGKPPVERALQEAQGVAERREP